MSYALGIDIGSSKVAAVIVDTEAGKTLEAVSILHAADLSSEPLFAEQDPSKLLESIDVAVKGLPLELRRNISAIGICGQMHGIVCWKKENRENSQLITWQDKRAADGAFMSVLRKTSGMEEIHPGYGVVTLAWLAKNRPDWLAQFTQSGTIMDYFASCICDRENGAIDQTNASSWGFYDPTSMTWHDEAVRAVGIPTDLLPTVVKTGTLAGELADSYAERWELPMKTPVCMPIGDSPAAVYSAKDAMASGCYLNIGTGAQLAIIVDPGAADEMVGIPGIEVRPFPGGKELIVATSICGGKAFLWLVETVEGWLTELGFDPIPRDTLFEKLGRLGQSRMDCELPTFLPCFSEERHAPGLLGSINGIGEDNFTMAALTRSLAIGMVAPLFDRMPKHLLDNKTQVVATGNGVRRSDLLKEIITEVSGLELGLTDVIEEAASGAARLALDHLS